MTTDDLQKIRERCEAATPGAHSRTDIPALLAHIDELQRRLDEQQDYARLGKAMFDTIHAIHDADQFSEAPRDESGLRQADAYIQAWVAQRDEIRLLKSEVSRLQKMIDDMASEFCKGGG